MATVFVFARRLRFAAFVARYRAWRFRQRRQLYVTCAECGLTLEADANELLETGHYRAAVFAARLQLEKALQNLCIEFRSECNWRRTKKSAYVMALFLGDNGRITQRTRSRVDGAYAKASKIVHGRACPSERAYEIVRDIRKVLHALDLPVQETCEQAKVVTGFAAMAGGAA